MEELLELFMMFDIFQVWKNTFNLIHFQTIATNKKNLVKMGLETLPYRRTWNNCGTWLHLKLKNLCPYQLSKRRKIMTLRQLPL